MRIELDTNDLRGAPNDVRVWLMASLGRTPPVAITGPPPEPKPEPKGKATVDVIAKTVTIETPAEPEDPAEIIGDCESLMRELINLTSVGQVKEVLKPHNRLSECPPDALPALRGKLIAAVAEARKAGE